MPFLQPSTAAEENYNIVHKKGRVVIERTFGQVKSRVYCIGSILRIKLERVPTIIITCFMLHNLAKQFGDPHILEEDVINYDDDDDGEGQDDLRQEDDRHLRRLGELKRQDVVEYLQAH